MPKVLTPEWMEKYAELWNSTPATRDGTAELSMTIEYRLAEDASRAGQFRVETGNVVKTGAPAPGSKPDYVLTASLDVWQRVADEQLGPARAILSRKIKFKGPLNVAMAHLPALEEALRMFGRVDGTEWAV